MKDASKERSPRVAYFTMEVGLDPHVPTYSGGLGMLAGDTLRAAADAGVRMVGVTLLHRKGYFKQHLSPAGEQIESPEDWRPEERLEAMDLRTSVEIEGRTVHLAVWRYPIRGVNGHEVPVYLLDAGLSENDPGDRSLTDHLYGGEDPYRLAQEVILGIGGIALLRALGHERFDAYHMNEGHSALLTLALLEERLRDRPGQGVSTEDLQAIRSRCVFTTHTPVPAGHDAFDVEMVRSVLEKRFADLIESAACSLNRKLNMTYLALAFSHYVNGVSMRHEAISRSMFPGYPINAITNGVHAGTWTSRQFQELFDKHLPEWRRDNRYLRYAVSIPRGEILEAHSQAKEALLEEVRARTGRRLDPSIFTIGFARRATAYKRPHLLFSETGRLERILERSGPLQILYAGKAHPRDQGGKDLIERIFEAGAALGEELPVIYLENYDMDLARHLVAGVDLWLNTPQRPLEASGTSGMKAAMNGVPSLSVLDGWWIEGNVEGQTGWAIGSQWNRGSDEEEDMASLYDKLEHVIMPMYYRRPAEFAEVMRQAIALNASFFNAQRMFSQYVENAYVTGGD
jgi:starch phosphorylase